MNAAWVVLYLVGIGLVVAVDRHLTTRLHRRFLARPLATGAWRELAPRRGDEIARFLRIIGHNFDIPRACYSRLSPHNSLDEVREMLSGDGLTFVEIESQLRSECECPRIELAGEDTLWSVFAASFISTAELTAP